MTHRWSGWPGAWCLDCGSPDLNEQAIADGADPETMTEQNVPCAVPGSNLHNPYQGPVPCVWEECIYKGTPHYEHGEAYDRGVYSIVPSVLHQPATAADLLWLKDPRPPR